MIPFNKPFLTDGEISNILIAHDNGQLSGDGDFTKRCSIWLENNLNVKSALLTTSCTDALELAALLANISPGDEVILPSYTFVSTANAFVLRGATPVFVDIQAGSLNLDASLIEQAITPKTKAIIPVHYAGVACDMDVINKIATKHDIMVIEDAAQSILSTYKGRFLGSLGDIGALSFHETKNIHCGEGGAILINDPELLMRAEIVREKGTNRSQFSRKEVNKYTWVDVGSSFLPGEVTAAFLLAQLNAAHELTERRLKIWNYYNDAFESLELVGRVRRPKIPKFCTHNAHIYYLLLRDLSDRDTFIESMRRRGIHCVFHYVPLHDSPYGAKVGKVSGSMEVTRMAADCLVRLPMWIGIEKHLDDIIYEAHAVLD